jgi:Sulfite exporter TauE/SafE.
MSAYIIIVLFAFLGGLSHTVIGFGSGIFMMLVMPYFFNMLQSAALSASISLGLTLVLAFQFRKYVEWKIVLVPTIVYVLVSNLVILFSDSLKMKAIAIGFGVFLIFTAIYSLFYAQKRKAKPTTMAQGIRYTLISGVFSGLFSIGGPYTSLYYLAASSSKEAFIANFQTMFMINAAIGMCTRIYKGFYTSDLIPFSIAGILAINLGRALGLKIVDKLDTATLKKIVYVAVGVSGVVTIVQQLMK